MSFGQVEGFCVDACVLLPHPIKSISQSCLDFLKENADRCFLLSTVKKEAIELIDASYTIIASDLQSNLKPFLESEGITELNNKQGKIMAQFFMERRKELKKNKKSNVSREMIAAIEYYVANQLHSLKSGESVPIDDFLASLITELSIKKHELKAPFKSIREEIITPHDSIISQIVIGTFIKNPKDVRHLASALIYQFQENKWIIFVTTDESDILSKQKELFDIFALQCSSPEWASDYFREMTKLKAPIQFFQEIQNYSDIQREFATTIEKLLGVKLLC